MIPTSLLSGVLELIALLGSTLRSPGAASGMRLSWTYCDRSLCPPKSAPGARAGTSASESAKTLPATVAPATLVEAAVRNLLRDKPPRSEGFATVSRLDATRSDFGLQPINGRLRPEVARYSRQTTRRHAQPSA